MPEPTPMAISVAAFSIGMCIALAPQTLLAAIRLEAIVVFEFLRSNPEALSKAQRTMRLRRRNTSTEGEIDRSDGRFRLIASIAIPSIVYSILESVEFDLHP